MARAIVEVPHQPEAVKGPDQELIDSGIRASSEIILRSLIALGVAEEEKTAYYHFFSPTKRFKDGKMPNLPWPLNLDGVNISLGSHKNLAISFSWPDGNLTKVLTLIPDYLGEGYSKLFSFHRVNGQRHLVDDLQRAEAFSYSNGKISRTFNEVVTWDRGNIEQRPKQGILDRIAEGDVEKKVNGGKSHHDVFINTTVPMEIPFLAMVQTEEWQLMQKVALSLENAAIAASGQRRRSGFLRRIGGSSR